MIMARCISLMIFITITSLVHAQSWAFQFLIESIDRQYPEVAQLKVSSLRDMIDEKKPLLLIDVRAESEYQISHIADATRHIDVDTTLSLITSQSMDTTIVLYCSVGLRSAKLVSLLQQQPSLKQYALYNLQGSLFDWANQGYPIVKTNVQGQAVKANTVHPYNTIWGRFLEDNLREF